MTLLLTAAFLSAVCQDKTLDNAEQMLRLATATQPLVNTAVVSAPIAEVWKAYTTSQGIESWMVARGTVDLRIGGKYRTSYTKGSDLEGEDVIENTILAYDPGHMVTIRNTQAPKKFPLAKALQELWTVIYFEPIDHDHTRVVCRMNGFSHEADSQKCKSFFRTGNQKELDWLVKKFAKSS